MQSYLNFAQKNLQSTMGICSEIKSIKFTFNLHKAARYTMPGNVVF